MPTGGERIPTHFGKVFPGPRGRPDLDRTGNLHGRTPAPANGTGFIRTLAWNANGLLSKPHVVEEGEEVAPNFNLLVVLTRKCTQTYMPQASDVRIAPNSPDCGAARV